MREPSIYFSTTFYQRIWPRFSDSFRAAKTKNDYFSLVCAICDFCQKDFLELTVQDAQNFFDDQLSRYHLGKLRLSTIQVRFSRLHSIANFILQNGLTWSIHTYQNPFTDVNLPEPDVYLTKEHVPDLKQMDSILTMCKADPQLYVAVSIVIRCSLTTSELCSLKRSRIIVDSTNHFGFILGEKRQKRVVKIPNDIAKLIQELISVSPSNQDSLFVNTRGDALTPRGLQRLYQKYVSFPKGSYSYTLSDLRNGSIAYLLSLKGVTVNEVANYVGVDVGWMHRYDMVVPELQFAPHDFANIEIKSLKSQ